MNKQTEIELRHWRPESYRTLRDAGIDAAPCHRSSDRIDRFERIVAAVGWVFGVVLIAIVLFW